MLKELAHSYKEKHAMQETTCLSAPRNALVSFFKYIAPCLLLLFIAGFTLFSLEVSAEPQGFSNQVQRAAPKGFGIETTSRNTIKGVLKNGHNLDYVLLEGEFVEALDSSMKRFSFADAAGDTIELQLTQAGNPFIDQKYYIWGRIQTSFFGASKINVIDYTLIN